MGTAGLRPMVAIIVATAIATPAAAATWVRYSFSGVGTAYAGGSQVIGLPVPTAVSFVGHATVDLDAHRMDFAAGELWSADGRGGFSALSASDLMPLRASATTEGLSLSSATGTDITGLQRWSLAAVLPAAQGDAGFPVFEGTRSTNGTVDFQVGTRRAAWTGTGSLATLTAERVSGPQAWLLSVAASPVPEPAAWATMVLGFSVIGWAARRRMARPTSAPTPELI